MKYYKIELIVRTEMNPDEVAESIDIDYALPPLEADIIGEVHVYEVTHFDG